MLNAYKFLDFVILLTEFPTIEEVCAPKNVCCCVQSLQLLRLFFFFFWLELTCLSILSSKHNEIFALLNNVLHC